MLVGHHGIFSLTPAWLLAVVGLAGLARGQRGFRRELALAIGGVSLVVIAFYLFRPLSDRNYGGMTSGFRWAFWLAPLWTFAVLEAVDRLSTSRSGRTLALVLLALSVVSVASPTWNPWTAPWLERWLAHSGWSGP